MQLDLAASLVKVADISGALGEAEAAAALTAEARELAAGLDEAQLDAGGRAKLSCLTAYFESSVQP